MHGGKGGTAGSNHRQRTINGSAREKRSSDADEDRLF